MKCRIRVEDLRKRLVDGVSTSLGCTDRFGMTSILHFLLTLRPFVPFSETVLARMALLKWASRYERRAIHANTFYENGTNEVSIDFVDAIIVFIVISSQPSPPPLVHGVVPCRQQYESRR